MILDTIGVQISEKIGDFFRKFAVPGDIGQSSRAARPPLQEQFQSSDQTESHPSDSILTLGGVLNFNPLSGGVGDVGASEESLCVAAVFPSVPTRRCAVWTPSATAASSASKPRKLARTPARGSGREWRRYCAGR